MKILINNISDTKERELALDPNKSFIVQAPAGSGKTTLLVTRYLKLLKTVKDPESIVALTFTRKAAYEMKSRIIKEIDINPNKLRIQTIDAYCNYLVRNTPILTQINIEPKIIQNLEAEIYYRQAAQAVLESIEDCEYTQYLETILLHLDNDWKLVENLFIAMLKSREQWLPHIINLKNKQDLRKSMESALAAVIQENQEECLAQFPQEFKEEFDDLLNFSKNSWQNITDLLLTKEGLWRKKITKDHGFPAQTSATTKQEKELFKLMKERMESLLIKFTDYENFRVSLENLQNSPAPNYNDYQWQLIQALLKLLPVLVAQLKLIFQEKNLTDYTEIATIALSSLEDQEDDTPSQLALNLDYKLQHLLIDEFQDTSVSHYRLIEKLVANWQDGDNHTLFIVGDPMQSIYKFREAEVGLFLRTQQHGIGPLKLHNITLTTNFRSTQNIVSWLNNKFLRIFPNFSNISLGAVPFQPSTGIYNDSTSKITINILKEDEAKSASELESNLIINIIHDLQKKPNETIAILARARSHFKEIISKLQAAKLDYQANELDVLSSKIIIRDLISLTRALIKPADKIAWLAILRAPWCDLNLEELHIISNSEHKTIWDTILISNNAKIITFREKIKTSFSKRGKVPWRNLIEEAWLALNGPSWAINESELEYAQLYFQLLENSCDHNQVNLELLQMKTDELYATYTNNTPLITLMTIHKAKGLEFDHVIIPGINRPTRPDTKKLMLWFEKPQIHGNGSSLLLSPIENASPSYKYLQLVDQKKHYYETGRLLYVALSRAKKSVHLIGSFDNKQQISQNSFLAQLEIN